MSSYKGILPKGFSFEGQYSVLLFIKTGNSAETYRVKGLDGKLYFLKLFNYSKLPRSAFDSENNLLEIEFLKNIRHENIVSYKESGELIFENKKFGYLILDFITGETLAERISREAFTNYYDVQEIISGVLKGLSYLHHLPDPIIHNEITPQNIMLDLSGGVPKAKIIDFGFARSFHSSTRAYYKVGLNLNYVAPECFNGLYSPQSDIFSVGAVMYQTLFGLPPWFKEVSKFQADRANVEEIILQERSKPLSFPAIPSDFIGYDETVSLLLQKALNSDSENRFQNADEFIRALNREIEVEISAPEEKPITLQPKEKKEGKGFDAIAGMKELKAQLQSRVINTFHNLEKRTKYRLTIPNGILLYGPPGCGKTFFAKHFAEEIGFNFMLLDSSDLQSKYINETGSRIAQVFKEAENNAPMVVFIDEINSLAPNRDNDSVHNEDKKAVNVLLAKMDRTGEKGIFVIGATNYPDKIDPALLRAGRLDKKFYLPPPDFEARKALFEMYLKNRPLDFGIDYDRLSTLTEHYVSADIELLANEATDLAAETEARISMKILEEVIRNIKPSVSLEELEKYEAIKAKMDGKIIERPEIGFKQKKNNS